MSSIVMGSNSQEKGSSSTGPSTKHVKASARSVEKQAPAFHRLQAHNQQVLNQTQQVQTPMMQTQVSATKHSIASTDQHHLGHQSQPAKTNKRPLMQKPVTTQQKHGLQNMNYQVVDQAFLSQLKSANTTAGPNERSGRIVTKTAKSSGNGRNPVNAAQINNGGHLFEFMSVKTGPSTKGASMGTGSRQNFPVGQVSQSTRHAGKNFDRLNFSSAQGGIGQIAVLAQQNSSSSQRQRELMQAKHHDSRNDGNGTGGSTNSRLLQYEHSNNRISLGTETESVSYHGQTSQLEPGSIQSSWQGTTTATAMTTKNVTSGGKRSFKSSERASKVGTANLKVQTSSGKPDFANLVRQPASTKNNVTKRQLEGQIISGIISKKTIAESLAKSSIPQKMLGTPNNGHLSTKSGKTSGVTPSGYINEASLLMQAVSSQMQTPHNQGKASAGQKGSHIQNQFSVVSQSKQTSSGATNLHRRKTSTQSTQQQPGSVQQNNQRGVSDQNFLVSELKKQHEHASSKLHQQQQQHISAQVFNSKGGSSQRVPNSNKNSAVKEPGKKAGTARSKAYSNINANNQLVKLKLVDTSDQFRPQVGGQHKESIGSMMFENYAIQPTQPVTATNQQRSQKVGANQFQANGKKSGITNSFVGKPVKSQERHSTHGHTGQKSVTNKYTKILAGVDDFDSNAAQIHVPGISSATNKIKKSFNFDTTTLPSHQEIQSLDNQSQGNDASGASRSKKQELMNKILLQNQQLAGNLGSPFTSNPTVGMKYLSTGATTSVAPGTVATSVRQSQKQAKVKHMKTNQLLLLQQQYAQASSQAQESSNQNATQAAQSVPANFVRPSLKQNGQQQCSGSTSRKVLVNSNNIKAKVTQPQLSFTSKSGVPTGLNVITKKQINSGQGKAAKSVSQSKPPAHAQYFNSAKVKSDGMQTAGAPQQAALSTPNNGTEDVPNRTAITTGNGKTQIEIQGNQMLCLWNVNIGQGAQANYYDQKGSFSLPYQMFQNNPNMMPPGQPGTQAFQQPGNFYPDQQQQMQQRQQVQHQQQQYLQQQQQQHQQQPLRQSSSKESLQQKQMQLQKQSTVKNRANPNKPVFQVTGNKQQQQATATRQIDINISRKSGNAGAETAELGIFNKHFKRQAQTKVPLNIRTKKQMSTEAIMQSQLNQTTTTTNNQTQSTKNNNALSHGKQSMVQKAYENDSQSTQSRLVKLLANTPAAAQIMGGKHQSTEKSKTSRIKPKAQNSSSMEQRRGSHSRQPQSRGHSSKKNKNHPMMLVTDNRELVEVAQHHMPRVNLSTTNKTKQVLIGLGSDRQYFGEEQYIETESVQQQQQQHKRMQSLMTDPQFITQLGLTDHQDGAIHNHLMANQTGLGQQKFKGHTTKNTAGNPNLFNQDQTFQQSKQQRQAYNSVNQQVKQQRQPSSKPNLQQQQKKAAIAANQINQLEANNLAVLSHNSGYQVNTGQNAPKAKKPPVAFNEEDLYQSDFLQDEDWIRKMEAEWQQNNDINKLIMRDEALANEARLAITSKGPILSLKTANPAIQNESKLKTQDVSEILRKAKRDFNNRETAAEPYEEDCVVEETDPDEISYPKHEPAQLSSFHKNINSNLSQHTSSTLHQQKSPKNHNNQGQTNEKTDTLLQGAFLREQQAQKQQQQHQQVVVSSQQEQEKQLNSVSKNEVQETTVEYPMTVRQALKLYAKTGKLTDFEKTELLDFKKVYFLGLEAEKINGKASAKLHNSGYDDENGDYNVVLKDHIYYRWEILDFLGKGSFGQALKCFDHKTQEIVALKIIKNKERYQHQAGVELRILQHLQKQDPEDQNNIIQIKDHCLFRNHLIISFELFSINLYEFIKNNNFQGVSLSLIRRFAIQMMQSLKFLRDEDIIHCDLKPENILLKSPDKSGIKIIDFGSSCFSNLRIYSYIQSRFYRAPEIIIGIPYTTAIDMWSFGCILIELYTGIPIFPGESEMEQLALIMQVFGVPPLNVLEDAERKDKFFRPGTNEPLHIMEDTDGSLRLPGSRPLDEIIGDQSETFFDFIIKCLKWDPRARITPFEALQHPWILEGLPRRVLIHHQRMLGLDVPSESSQASMPTEPPERPSFHPNQIDHYENEVSNDQSSKMLQYQVQDDQQNGLNLYKGAMDVSTSDLFVEAANPFELADNDDYADDVNQEMLDVHNRSTQQQQDQPQHLQLPARVIDNGMANQFRVESQQNKQQANTGGEANGGGNTNDQGQPSKQELSRTQPMPSQFLHGCKKAATKQSSNYNNQVGPQYLNQHAMLGQHQHEAANFDNLNYQSHENGQQMLQFGADINNNGGLQFHHRQQNQQNDSYDDQLADFIGTQDMADQDELMQDNEQFNPKSKTTNMSSMLKQINQSIKKTGADKQKHPKQQIMVGDELGANPMQINIPTTRTTRYKLPQSSGLGNTPSTSQQPQCLSDDFNLILNNNQSSQQQESSGNVSFLMKHRIRQAAGDQTTYYNAGKQSASQEGTSTSRTTTAAASNNHGNNKNVNKIAMKAQKEQEMVSDYAVDPAQGSSHHRQVMIMAGGANRMSEANGGPTKLSSKNNQQRPQKMMMNNFLQSPKDSL